MGLFGSRKRNSSYQGFSKYANEVNDYERTQYAGLPNNGISRSDSLSNGAGSAALAALRLHQNSQPVETPVNKPNNIRRSNSINSSIPRSNSLRTYSYHPKGSYTPGQATIPNSRRYSSLTSSSNLSQFRQPPPPQAPAQRAPKRLSSINSQSTLPKQTLYEENSEEEGETVVTTQTTKVVDSQGRVISVTTKTIKTLPDGSNIIETTTKNISRSNSRTNSLRTNSLLASPRDQAYNLQKIDEHLHDFEYNYELDNQNHPDHQYPATSVDRELDPDLQHNADSLRLNTDEVPVSPQKLDSLRNNSFRASSINSSTKKTVESPTKPLKSILKNTSRPNFEQKEENPLAEEGDLGIEDRPEDNDSVSQSVKSESQHPYKSIGTPLSEPPRFKVPDVPRKQVNNETIENRVQTSKTPQPQAAPVRQSPPMKQSLRTSPKMKQTPVLRSPNGTSSPPYSKTESITSPSNSIKFDERVETIPIYDSYSKSKEQANQELYSKAMEVAMEKVYGSPHMGQEDSNSQETPDIDGISESVIEKKNKRDKKLEIIGHSGVNDNYRYENHHKDFAVHSMRDPESKTLKNLSRKDRAKEEKRQQKEYENQLKLEEKQRKADMKKQAKDEAKMKKMAERETKKSSPKRSLFGRLKKDNTDASTLGSEVSSLSNSLPVTNTSESPQQFESPAKSLRERNESNYVSPTRNNYAIPEDDVLHPVPEQRAEPITEEYESPVPSAEPVLEDSKPILTPQIEPTIRLESTEAKDSPFDGQTNPVFMEQEKPPTEKILVEEPVPIESSDYGVDLKDSLVEPVQSVEPVVPVVPTEPFEPVVPAESIEDADKALKQDETKADPEIQHNQAENVDADTYSGIPLPILNEVTTDSEIHDDSGLATEDEEYLQSPNSKRSDANEQFYEAEDHEKQKYMGSPSVSHSESQNVENATILDKLDNELDQRTYEEPGTEEPEADAKSEAKPLTMTNEDQKVKESIGDTADVVDFTPNNTNMKSIQVQKHHNLSDLIKMGQSNDTTEDSFVPPDAQYDSDSDVSSKFSSDLNAALRRITDDKGNQIGDSSGARVLNDENVEDGIMNKDKPLMDPPSSKSAPPTDSSDDRSPQPSRSTMATKEEFKPEVHGNFDDSVITNQPESNPKKVKKPSKFKTKILKYFVNSYQK